jgi:hypothetical protein
VKFANLLLACAALALLSGCACPPRTSSYAEPLATLQSWQSHLCFDDVQGEWRCLSTDYQRSMGGFQTYVAVRRQLLDEGAAFSWFLGRADLGDYVVQSVADPVARRAMLTLAAHGEIFEVEFLQETTARLDLDDGSFLFAILDKPLDSLIGQTIKNGRVIRQWIDLTRPTIAPEDLSRISSVQLEHRWKINAITGLQPPPEIDR